MKKVIVFFPNNLYPPQFGFHKRGLQLLAGLRELGAEVTLASSTLSARPEWNPASLEGLRREFVKDIAIYKTSWRDDKFISMLSILYRRMKRKPRVDSAFKTPPGMRRWFRRLVERIGADAVLMNYAYWHGLTRGIPQEVKRIIDIIDLLTLNLEMRNAIQAGLPEPPIHLEDVNPEILDLAFYDRLGLAAEDYEYRIYDSYDHTITISESEARLIRQHTHNTDVIHIPYAEPENRISNEYDGNALFATGPNLFNVQGYLYFAKHVLPKVLVGAPDFNLEVTGGYIRDQVVPTQAVTLRGFVPGLTSIYEHAPFSVCPVFGGTGQQTKIVESMATGVPVVALARAAETSPIEHRYNGMIAKDAGEFAGCIEELWKDRPLCRRLGEAARETSRRSGTGFLDSLSTTLV